MPKDRWPEGNDFEQVVKQHWDDDFGDRRQEIVFIGLKADMSEQKIRDRLDACLIEDYLTAPDEYQKLQDPFPAWFQQVASA